MSKQKGLMLRDAILSGKKFKRPGWDYWVDGAKTSMGFWDQESLLADDYVLEQSDADKIKELELKIQELEDVQNGVLAYCHGQTKITWAAYIAGYIMNMDFRDVTDSVIESYLESKESK